MIVFNNKEDVKKNNLYKENDPITWQCGKCKRIRTETEFRNLLRRKNLCDCKLQEEKFNSLEEKLKQVDFTIVDKNWKNHLNSKGNISTKEKIQVQCLKCSSISTGYFFNYITRHKICNCNKNFTTDLTVQEFINKWPDMNQKNFTLLDEEYNGRNFKYHIRCNNCGKDDIRWGITLIDLIIKCKYCSNGSIGEQRIATLLEEMNIEYIKEYSIHYNNTCYRFDFFIPKYNTFIEYNGCQHYKAVDYFGGEEKFNKQQYNDTVKAQYCKENKYQLLIFPYYQSFDTIREILREKFND